MNKPYRTIFMGTPNFALPSFKALIENPDFEIQAVITQPDKPIGRNKTPQPSPVKKLATEHQIEVLTPTKVKDNTKLFEQLKKFSPDIIVVTAYGKILPQEILDIPKMGIINIHASLLPKYRGASPIAGSILAGDEETGVTLMKISLEMDTGPIIAVSDPVIITKNDTTATLSEKLSQTGADLLIKYLPQYLEEEITPQPQNESQASYVKLITKQDGIINWNEPAELIERKIRAYQPWPSVFTKFNDKLLKIFRAEVINKASGQPGTIQLTDDKYPMVTTAKGSLKLLQMQLEGKKPVSGKDFLSGYPNLIDSQLR